MTAKNQIQLLADYADPAFCSDFASIYAIREFFAKCIISPSYKPPVDISKSIILTPEGDALFSLLKSEFTEALEDELKLAIFIVFYHQDLFIDVDASDCEMLKDILSKEILSENITFPWVFDDFYMINTTIYGQIS